MICNLLANHPFFYVHAPAMAEMPQRGSMQQNVLNLTEILIRLVAQHCIWTKMSSVPQN